MKLKEDMVHQPQTNLDKDRKILIVMNIMMMNGKRQEDQAMNRLRETC